MKPFLKRTYLRICLVLFVCGFHLLFGRGLNADQKPHSVTAIKNVRVFDGKELLPSRMVLIQDETVKSLGIEIAIPTDAEIIDGSGKTLLPGLFDCHVHIWHADNLKQAAIFGVTTVVDMFMDTKTMNSIKKAQSSGRAKNMAWLISSGILATAPGGHGTQYGMPIPTLIKPEDAGPWVKARAEEGSDFIKIIWDDGGTYKMKQPTLDGDTVAAVIKEAHAIDKMVIIHAASLEQCRFALDAGVDGLAHLFFNNAHDPEFGRLAAEKNAFIIPTLAVLEGMHGIGNPDSWIKDPNLHPLLNPTDIQMLEMHSPLSTEEGSYEAAETALKQLLDAGVPILAGTDAPNPGTTYGASIHRELELLVRAGLPPVDALRAATSLPAEIFGLKDRGRIQLGMTADLVLVEGDPTNDIRRTRHIIDVWKGGRKIDREKYRAAAAEEREARKNQRNAPAPKNSQSGLISDFEGDRITSEYGAGWSISSDTIMGGKSKAEYKLVESGAQDSRGALLVTGEINEGAPNRWAGAFFTPGETMMQPANLSAKNALSFWARGDGKTYSVMIFAQSLGFIPAMVEFKPGQEWEEFMFPFEDFGIEGFDIQGIFIGSSSELGPFQLRLDLIKLQKNP